MRSAIWFEQVCLGALRDQPVLLFGEDDAHRSRAVQPTTTIRNASDLPVIERPTPTQPPCAPSIHDPYISEDPNISPLAWYDSRPLYSIERLYADVAHMDLNATTPNVALRRTTAIAPSMPPSFIDDVEPGYEQLMFDAVAIRDALRAGGELL